MTRCLLLPLFVLSAAALMSGMATGQEANRATVVDEDDPQFVYQPTPERPTSARYDDAARAARRAARNEFVRLSRVPNMLGDTIGIAGQLSSASQPNAGGPGKTGLVDLPSVAGRAFRIVENNKPLPMDRIYFNYNGFQNALTTGIIAPNGTLTSTRDTNVDLYTVGFEKTFFDGNDSIDVRVPMLGSLQLSDPSGNTASTGTMGDIALILKHLLYADSEFSLAAGMGIGLPTGSDVTGQTSGVPYRLNTEAVHLMPYIGALVSPNDDWFFQGFAQLDLATNGNQVTLGPANTPIGTLTEQNLLIFNVGMGRWLFRDDEAYALKGIAGIVELHYTTTLQDADIVSVQRSATNIAQFDLGNIYNRVDVVNLTAGLQFQIGPLSNLRVACVAPLKDSAGNRWFDSEIVVSFNRFF